MKKAFQFIESLRPLFFEFMGYPTIKIYSDYAEVYFDSSKTFSGLGIFDLNGYDEMRFFGGDGCITFIYTFYNENEA